MKEDLYLHRLVLPDYLSIQKLSRQLKLTEYLYDPDYIYHSLLLELLGPGKLLPFVQDPRKRGLALLGYSMMDSENLRDLAGVVAPTEIYNLINWKDSQSKKMPRQLNSGTCFRFRTRVCPLVRGPSYIGKDRQVPKKKNAEVDVYLARCWQKNTSADRETIYLEWLENELGREKAAMLESASMTGFRLKWALRRGRNRNPRTITLPDALFKGALSINNPQGFARLIARGIGRHRSFGFGMLLLITSEDK